MTGAADPATAQREVVANAIRGLRRVTMVPEVTMRIVQITSDPDYRAAELHQIIALDPILCMRVLRIINSAYYRLPHPVISLERAIVLLGAQAIKNIALVASLGGLLQGSDESYANHARMLWNHSLAVAAAARSLAEAAGIATPEDAFLGGLLHDIGFAIEMRYDARRFDACIQALAHESCSMLAWERKVFGATHLDFAAGLCDKWGLPPLVRRVAAEHHNRADAPITAEDSLCLLIQLADGLAAKHQLGFHAGSHEHIDLTRLARLLELPTTVLDEIGRDLPALAEELKQALA